MCYSGRCVFENQSGDCSFPKHIPSIRKKYGNYWCDPSMSGEDNPKYEEDLIDIRNLMKEYKEMKKIKEEISKKKIKLRNKLQKIKN